MQSRTAAHDEMIGLPEVAMILGVHRATVNDMVRSRRLKARRRGAHWFVRPDDLAEFKAMYVRPSNAPAPRLGPCLPASAPRILELLSEFESASAVELAHLIGLHEGNIRKHLRLLQADGLVHRLEDGQWSLMK
ncbi:MAG: helix-turn-helix domain-containing protein [Acidimicrobiales bacterium]